MQRSVKAFTFLFFLVSFTTLPTIKLKAQFFEEALMFSRRNIGGTARVQGMGGAQLATGGDISHIHSNPAGLGFYNRSDFSISPAFNVLVNNALPNYNNVDPLDPPYFNYKTQFNIPNFGIVFNNTKDDLEPGAWRGGSFGISYNRTNHFRNNYEYGVVNNTNDFIDYLWDEGSDDLFEMGIRTRLFVPSGNGYDVNPVIDEVGIDNDQVIDVETRGSQQQWSFSYGGNFSDRFYVGGGIGILSFNHHIKRGINEFPFQDGDYQGLEYRQTFRMEGNGVNANIGAIFRPIDAIRIGLNYLTPTHYTVRYQREFHELHTFFTSQAGGDESSSIDYMPWSYNFLAPGKLGIGLAYFFGKNGFLTADIESINYGRMRFLNSEEKVINIDQEQNHINNVLRNTINVRIGGEYRYDMFRFRAGYAYQPDPFIQNDEFTNLSRSTFTGGLGIRLPDYYFDLGIINTRFSFDDFPYFYQQGVSPDAVIRNSLITVMLTAGFYF
jgi:hypothetical protein